MMNWISTTSDLLIRKGANLLGKSLRHVENRTDDRLTCKRVKEDFDLQSCRKRKMEEPLALPVRSMVGKVNYENMEKILRWLKDDNVNTIGIFGMGGCGKTMLAIHMYNHLLQSEHPPLLVWVTVGIDFNIDILQRHISRAVGLDLEYEEDENRRAAILHNFLSTRGRYVVFLDDIWNFYPLLKVGIPLSGTCKVIITTRMLSVCKRTGCQKMIKIGMLGIHEAWHLFSSEVGHDVLATDEVRLIAELVCRECGGLPLAIVTVARSLSGVYDIYEWRMALEELRYVFTEHVILMLDHLFPKLHLSYNRLSNAKIKHCFLYCALYPQVFEIQKEELIRLWIAEGLIDEVSSLRAQYDKGHVIVNALVDYCLLESSEDELCVKMHDMIRLMAKRIIVQKSGHRFFSVPSLKLQELLEALEFMEDLNAVSPVKNSISPKFPELPVLLLQHNPLDGLPHSFFLHMPSLRVLDLSNTSIKRLPDSVCDLENLRSLLLHRCDKLIHVPSLAKLKALRILDLGHSAIGEIPCGLQKLSMLRELDLSGFPKLKEFEHVILAMLTSLKRISCDVAGVPQELQSLRSLQILDARFRNIGDFNSYVRSLHWRMLDSFHLQVGDTMEQEQRYHKSVSYSKNVVSLHGCSLVNEKGEWLVLPDNLHELYIDDCTGFGSLLDILISDFKDTSFKDVMSINSRGHNSEPTALSSSRYIFDGTEKGGGFLSKLEICTISRCHDIKQIFTHWPVMDLENLEVMRIRDCTELKELITKEVGNRCRSKCSDNILRLPNLKSLELTRLPMLSSIYEGVLVCTSLQSIEVIDCRQLMRLPFSFFSDNQHKSLIPTLERIEGEDGWWDSLEFDQTETKSLLQTVFRLKSGRAAG